MYMIAGAKGVGFLLLGGKNGFARNANQQGGYWRFVGFELLPSLYVNGGDLPLCVIEQMPGFYWFVCGMQRFDIHRLVSFFDY